MCTQNRRWGQEAIRKERPRRDAQINKVKDRYQEKDAASRERRSARELRAKIVCHTKSLSQKLLQPNDKQHIPEGLRQAAAAVLEAINMESLFTVDTETGKRSKQSDGDPVKRTEAFRKLKEQYEGISKGQVEFIGVLDPALAGQLDEVISMKEAPLASMNTDQLTVVWRVVKAVEQSISTANKLLGQTRYAGAQELADGIRRSSSIKRLKGNWRGRGPALELRIWNKDKKRPPTGIAPGGWPFFHFPVTLRMICRMTT